MAQRRHLEAVESFESIDRWSPTYRWRWDEQYAYRTAWKRTLSRFREDGQFAIGLLLSRRATTRWPHPDLWAHHGYFAGALGHSQESESAYRKALQIDPYHLESSRGLRRILFQQGQIEKGLSRWKKTHLVHRILERGNLVATRYQTLLDRGQALESDPSPENRLEWARSLGHAGWLEEASDTYRSLPPVFRQRHRREIEDLRAFRGWIHAMHGLFLDIYRRRARGETTPSYSRVRQRMQILCPERFGLDIGADLKHYYAVFSESDPFHPQPGGLGRLLDRYNYFADLHNGTGEPELRLMHRLEHRRVRDRLFSGLDGRFEVLISDRTLIPSFSEYLWGDLRLSGRAFLSRRGFYLCVDTLQPSLPGLKRLIERTRKAPPHNPNIRGVTWDPAAARILERRHLTESLLLDPNSTREPQWDEMHRRQLQARLDNVWYHELGHIADFHHYVPMYAHLLRNLGMALSQGFSPGKIHTRFEEIAETYSLARSPHTPLILLDNLRRLHLDPDSLLYRLHVAWQETSPEDSPYTRAAKHIFTRLGHSKRGSRKVGSIPYQLSRTDSEKIRERTRELLARDDLD
jgi:tetratricopeptide (TPR) repeat protein